MKYLTLAETFRQNAQRHRARVDAHFASEQPEWAQGSLKKAVRNEVRAERMELPQPWPGIVSAFVDSIADAIINGDDAMTLDGISAPDTVNR